MKNNNYWRFILRETTLPEHLTPGQNYLLERQEEDLLYQLTRVLRAKVGDSVILMNKNRSLSENYEAHFQVQEINKNQIKLVFESGKILYDPLPQELSLALALPNKPAKLEMILQHCTELGVSRFKLIESEYSNYHHQLRMDRLETILMEAVEQSERARIPQIISYVSLDQYFELADNDCYAGLERQSDLNHRFLQEPLTGKVDVLIGPEGGFSEREINLIKASSKGTFSLGKQILRNETAALVACGLFGLMLQG